VEYGWNTVTGYSFPRSRLNKQAAEEMRSLSPHSPHSRCHRIPTPHSSHPPGLKHELKDPLSRLSFERMTEFFDQQLAE
jgi:hypothetical protein